MNIFKNTIFTSLIILLFFSSQTANASTLSEKEEAYLLSNINKPQANINIKLVYKALYDDNAALKKNAITYLGKRGDVDSVKYLIDALLIKGTNSIARKALKKLTGEDFGFKWNAHNKDKQIAIKKWSDWMKERDLIIKEVLFYAPKHNIKPPKYKVYRAHLIGPEKTKWIVSFTTYPPSIGATSVTVDRDTRKKTIIRGR